MSALAVRPRFRRGALFFLAVFLVYVANGRRLGTHDSTATALLPFALLAGEGLALDRYVGENFPESLYCFQRGRDGRLRNSYPIGAALLATPFYLPALLLPDLDVTEPIWGRRIHAAFEKTAAAGLAALAGLLLLLRLEHDLPARRALLAAGAFCLATPAWAVSSQSLFLHGPASLVLSAALLALAPAALSTGRAGVAGALAGALLWVRPANAFLAAALALMVLRRGRRASVAFALPAAALAALFVVQGLREFGAWRGGYAGFGVWFDPALVPSGLLALLASNRGLLFAVPFAPLLLVPWRRPRSLARSDVFALAAAAVATLGLFAATTEWHSGLAYSGRYPIDILPVLFLLGARVFEPPIAAWRAAALGLLGALALGSQAVGAFVFPHGESGRATLMAPGTAWSVRRSAPYLALQAGPAPPELFPLARWGAQRAQDAEGRRAEVRLEQPLPRRWLQESRFPARIHVVNSSARTWPAWGSYGGDFATRLVVFWQQESGSYWELSEFALGGDVPPGGERTLDVQLLAPRQIGAWRVRIVVAERTATGLSWFRHGDEGIVSTRVVVKPAAARKHGRLDWPPPRPNE